MLRALRTLFGLVTTALYILIVAPPFLLVTALLRTNRPLFVAGKIGVHWALTSVGIKVKVEGAEHLQRHRAAVYMSNHVSHVDPPALFHALRALHPRLRTWYKAELRSLPVLVWVWDFAGFVPIERANRAQSLPAVERAAEALRQGNSFFIFPEGTRSRSGDLLPFKKGGFLMAIAAQAPIVPVIASGGRNAMTKGSWVVTPVTVTVRLGPPIETTGLTQDDRDTLAARVREAMQAMLSAES
jgi:1-acyl-sn-glycerol-3-phosphate acyltransferase